jgi:ABC-type glutathione transport system ATPase component
MRTEINEADSAIILEARGLTKIYGNRGVFTAGNGVVALRDVDLTLSLGRTLALVGESGSGKSTLARCLVRLEQVTSGDIRFEGVDFLALCGNELRCARHRIQLIFQEPLAALNPRFSALDVVLEPLIIAGNVSKREAVDRAQSLMEVVGLPDARGSRRAHEFSGGQKQRLALARALITNPKALIFDEAFSGLDLSVQAQMINLLHDLKATREIAYLFISHDLRLVRALADEVAVMKNGIIVETAATADVFNNPQHSYTQSLLLAITKNGGINEMAIRK